MFHLLYFTQLTTYLACLLAIIVCCALRSTRRKNGDEPPSPMGLPVIGHLHLLAGYEVPYQAFSRLGKRYGEVVGLRLGSVRCVVVNGYRNIREALVTKGNHFDSRPNFERYQRLFCGNKENSLAFCDWSETQKTRREMLRAYTFPRAFTNKFHSLETIISEEVTSLVRLCSTHTDTHLKPLLLTHCANIFMRHFCSRRFDTNDPDFTRMVKNFDTIFWEVNQGYAADFLPFLIHFHEKNLGRMNELAHGIRHFVLERVIGDRFESYGDDDPNDYVESLVGYVKKGGDLSWDTALFALEDIIGGHSAVGNFLVKLFGFLVNEPEVQKKIQVEIDAIATDRLVTISDRSKMPYTESTIFEAVRLIASPIVPRVANQDSSINGYTITKGTLIFLNNYELSMSEDLWKSPEKFQPERFIQDNKFVKPEHFLPFGGGRRSCMGYKMVQLVSFGVLSGLLQEYTIEPVEGESYRVPIGSLALPERSYSFRFVARR